MMSNFFVRRVVLFWRIHQHASIVIMIPFKVCIW